MAGDLRAGRLFQTCVPPCGMEMVCDPPPLTILGGLQALRDEFLDASQQEKFRLKFILDRLPDWPWEWWALAVSVALILCVLEGAYRLNKNVESNRDAQLVPIAAQIRSGMELLGRPVTNDDELRTFISDFRAFLEASVRAISGSFSSTEAQAFAVPPTVWAASIPGTFNSAHADLTQHLKVYLERLGEIIRRHGAA